MSGSSAKKRLLLGPFSKPEWSEYMVGAFDDFDTLTFGSWAGADVHMLGMPSFADVMAALPSDWEPDYLVLWRPEYGYIPAGLEHAEFPVAMMISDWYLAFSDSLEAAWRVDLIVTGTRGERVFRAAGFDNVVAMPMLGYQPDVDGGFDLPTAQRDIDVYMGGNPNWAVHRQREQVVAELLDLPDSIRVLHGSYVGRTQFNRLLGRSKIVVDQTVIGEINMKVYEASAAGACLFVEEDNLDIRNYLVPDESVVLFNKGNLREKICHYLADDAKRDRIARQAQKKMARYTYRENFHNIMAYFVAMCEQNKLPARRPCFDLSAVERSRGILGYSLYHNNGDWNAAINLLGEEKQTAAVGPLLGASVHYLAHLNGQVKAWDTSRILESFRRAHAEAPLDFPAAYCWSRVAALHLEVSAALPLLNMTSKLLQTGCAVPFSCADVYLCHQETRFVLERIAWEALEVGESVDEALRPLFLEDIWLLAANLAIAEDRLAEAIDSLQLAVAAYPQGSYARPLLAKLLATQDEWLAVARIWREHLVLRPLDFVAMEGLFAAARECSEIEITEAEIRRYRQGHRVMD